ncbi:winged helix DNA-binding protein [Mesorhizobium sp. LHD-90]|uniref:MarR family winged helix-turn-helix transcriptional regulator n=1 Tax=Mesorhizobium sp. LHD-90 TaxID=3071414 RepID=UPI0027DFBEE8|nr:winged helix DNA-binding protein [Mesorhizobium sp. LHD-90]MDQ6436058.1 winged helix DNA-binding protein [Mesorhizobium sp. LHD-90]
MQDPIKPFADITDEESRAAGSAADAVRCFRLISYTGQRLRYLYDQRLREEGLTSQQGFLLTVVRMRGRPTLGEVAAAMSTTHQNAKQVASALERKGMLKIVSDDRDARVRRLEATEAGQPGWENRNAEDYAAIAGWFAALSGDEQQVLVELLSRLARTVRGA